MHRHPGAGELHPVGDQALHRDRHGQREPAIRCAGRARRGGRRASGSLRYIHSASGTCTAAAPRAADASADFSVTAAGPACPNKLKAQSGACSRPGSALPGPGLPLPAGQGTDEDRGRAQLRIRPVPPAARSWPRAA